MGIDLVNHAYKASEMLSNLKILLLMDDKLSKENYLALKIFVDNCKEKIDEIIDLIGKYCNDEKIDSIEEDIIGCPNCNFSITRRNYPKFCGNCGQALYWSD